MNAVTRRKKASERKPAGRRPRPPSNDPVRLARRAKAHDRLVRTIEALRSGNECAWLIFEKVRASALADGFTRRDIHQHGWRGLSSIERVSAGLAVLVERGFLQPVDVRDRGRPKTVYRIDPKALATADLTVLLN